jgi:lipopolysaccharide transport system permease protein
MIKKKYQMQKFGSLILNFATSDLKIKYRNSVLGFFWSFLEPLLLLGVLYVVFTNVFENSIDNFPLYLLLGLILYNTVQKGTDLGLTSISSKGDLIKQVYFPRMIPAVSATATATIMLIFELMVFGIFMAIFQFVPSVTILLLPLILLLECFLIFGLCLPLSVLNIKFNDIQFIWRVILQAGFFLTPIFYTLDILPETLQNILKYSPMVQIMNMARDVTLYNTIPSFESITIAIVTTTLIFVIGFGIFYKLKSNIIEAL